MIKAVYNPKFYPNPLAVLTEDATGWAVRTPDGDLAIINKYQFTEESGPELNKGWEVLISEGEPPLFDGCMYDVEFYLGLDTAAKEHENAKLSDRKSKDNELHPADIDPDRVAHELEILYETVAWIKSNIKLEHRKLYEKTGKTHKVWVNTWKYGKDVWSVLCENEKEYIKDLEKKKEKEDSNKYILLGTLISEYKY